MENQVEDVKSKTDIVSLIGGYVDLKKAGKNFKGLCPFHSEKTPSFIVSPDIQRYKCFGCGVSGDVYTFLEKYEGMEFYEALKFLAESAGVTLKNVNLGEKGRKDKLYKINNLVLRFYSYVLTKHPAGEKALDYLKERGITKSEIETFHLGYSPNQPLALKKFVVDKNKTSLDDLSELGVVYKGNRGYVDRFRGRVIFPLFDHRGNTIGFAGRILPELEGRNLAKYINSPETPLYHKSSVLYGLNVTKEDIKKSKKAVVVEGELDMISSWKIGIKNIVAIKGTALTTEQIKLLSRYTEEIILALDADSAGSSASRRGIEISEKEGLAVKITKLSRFKDPDEAARKDPEYLKKRVSESVGIWDFLIELVFKDYKDGKGSEKAKISKEIVPILASIKDKIVQAHYAGVVARKLAVSEDAVIQAVDNFAKDKRVLNKKESNEEKVVKKSRREILEERLLAIAFDQDPSILLIKKMSSFFTTPFAKRIYREYIAFSEKYKNYKPQKFMKFLPAELNEGFSNLVFQRGDQYDDQTSFDIELSVVKRELKEISYKDKLKELTKSIEKSEKGKKSAETKKLQENFRKTVNKLSKLEEVKSKGIILS